MVENKHFFSEHPVDRECSILENLPFDTKIGYHLWAAPNDSNHRELW